MVLLLQEGTAPINLYVEDAFHRAARGGAGGVKSITNYAPVRVASFTCLMKILNEQEFCLSLCR